MTKKIFFLILFISVVSHFLKSQTLGNYTIYDYLITATHPNSCTQIDYVTGLPNDSIWVNFSDGDVTVAYFKNKWIDAPGPDLLFETGYHQSNYRLRLILDNGYSASYNLMSTGAAWLALPNTTWQFLQRACPWNGITSNRQHYIIPLDFSIHFGLQPSDIVKGIEITYLQTVGNPDLAGVYIITTPCTTPVIKDTTIMLCENDSVLIQDTYVKQAGIYPDTLYSGIENVCDTITRTEVLIKPISSHPISITTCFAYTHNNQTYTASGIYTQTLTSSYGCDSLIVLNITIIDPTYTHDVITTCSGKPVYIHGISRNTAGLYTATYTAVGGCDSISSVNFLVTPPISLSITLTPCDSIIINNIAYTTTGEYVQTLKNNNGCDSILTIKIVVHYSVQVDEVFFICRGEVLDINGVEVKEEGTYVSVYSSTNACDSIVSTVISFFPDIVSNFEIAPNPATVHTPVEFTDSSPGAVSWQWSFEDVNTTYSTIQNPVYNFQKEGVYSIQLVATNKYGCKDSLKKYLSIEPEKTIYIPNTFSPNFDNLNDIFLPVISGIEIEEYSLSIFDRWGEQIFFTSNPGQGWDGRTNNGKDIAQIDTYVWKVNLTDTQGQKRHYTGHVNLLR